MDWNRLEVLKMANLRARLCIFSKVRRWNQYFFLLLRVGWFQVIFVRPLSQLNLINKFSEYIHRRRRNTTTTKYKKNYQIFFLRYQTKNILWLHRMYSSKNLWSTFLVQLFKRFCCSYVPPHFTIRQCTPKDNKEEKKVNSKYEMFSCS